MYIVKERWSKDGQEILSSYYNTLEAAQAAAFEIYGELICSSYHDAKVWIEGVAGINHECYERSPL